MPQHVQITVKEYYYDWYRHRNNQRCKDHLILENYVKITKIRIIE